MTVLDRAAARRWPTSTCSPSPPARARSPGCASASPRCRGSRSQRAGRWSACRRSTRWRARPARGRRARVRRVSRHLGGRVARRGVRGALRRRAARWKPPTRRAAGTRMLRAACAARRTLFIGDGAAAHRDADRSQRWGRTAQLAPALRAAAGRHHRRAWLRAGVRARAAAPARHDDPAALRAAAGCRARPEMPVPNADADRLPGRAARRRRRSRRRPRGRGRVVHQPVDARDVRVGAAEPLASATSTSCGRPTCRVAGFCAFWLVVDEMHINNLAVLPEYRGRGLRDAPDAARARRSAAAGRDAAPRSRCARRTTGARRLLRAARLHGSRRCGSTTTRTRSKTR